MITRLEDLERVRAECRSLVTKKSLVSAGAAVVPIPGIDLVADVGLLTTLLPQISERFELDHDQVSKLEPHIAQQVLVMASSMGNNVIGRMVTKRIVATVLRRVGARVATGSLAKYVPFVGSAVAATISFGAMKMVGNAHIEEMQSACISGATDHEDAAETLISDFVGQMGGEITKGAVRVWIQGETREKIYDWTVDLIIPEDDGEGAGPGDEDDEIEVEAEIELIERI